MGAQKADSAAIWLPRGVQVGWGVSEVQAAFVTTRATVQGTRLVGTLND